MFVKKTTNPEVRNAMKENNVMSYLVAKRLGIHENTFGRWMREEMTIDQKNQVLEAIVDVKTETEGVAQ